MASRKEEAAPAKRGRPRKDIDPGAVADAVAELFQEGGPEAVSIIEAADKLNVSRATLYRTFPSKEHLVGVLFERSTQALTADAEAIVANVEAPEAQLRELIRLLVRAAIDMRHYMPVFFGGGDMPSDVMSRWHQFSREFENLWVRVVSANMEAGTLAPGDPVVTARLLLGQCIWVSRWYRTSEPYQVEAITEAALRLLPTVAPQPEAHPDHSALDQQESA
ncbi:MAG: TetR family transcriptional regulator [Acidimicrobiaceae bacterium]|nr:TetR family transcriptional regulator [Acidimicrobiaceae bacterium]